MGNDKRRLISSAIIVVAVTFVGKVLGLVREAYIASAYGATYIADVYVLQNGIVNALCSVFLCVVTTTFIPLAFEAREKEREKQFITSVLLGYTAIAILLATVLAFFPEPILACVAPGVLGKYSGDTMQAILVSVQISMMNIVLLMVQGLLRALLQLNDKMQVASLQGIVLNILLLVYLVYFADNGLMGLSVAMVVAQIAVTAVFFAYAIRHRMLVLDRVSAASVIRDCETMLVLALPVVVMSVLSQASYLVDRNVASGFDEGTMAMIGYATTIGIAVNGIFGESINNVIYPRLSELASGGKSSKLSLLGRRMALYASIPVAAIVGGIIPVSASLICLIYGHGTFTPEHVEMTSQFLMLYMPGMFFYYERDFLNRICYSQKRTGIPSLCAAFGFISTIILNLTIPLFLGARGIVAASSIASFLAFALQLGLILGLHYVDKPFDWFKDYAVIVASFILSILITWLIINHVTYVNNALLLVLSIGLMAICYCVCLALLKTKEVMKYMKEIK